jgi:hypothetical protein
MSFNEMAEQEIMRQEACKELFIDELNNELEKKLWNYKN